MKHDGTLNETKLVSKQPDDDVERILHELEEKSGHGEGDGDLEDTGNMTRLVEKM